jgi:hypothetical protein
MNAIANKLLKVVIPITLGTVIFVGCFWIADRLDPNPGISCEDPSWPAAVYLTAMGILAIVGIVYQLAFDILLRGTIKMNKFLELIFEVIVFVACYTVVEICFVLNSKTISIEVLTIGLVLGSVYTVSRLLFGKLIK